MRKKEKMPTIKVKRQYSKLCGQKTAKLLAISTTYIVPEAPAQEDFVEYNAAVVNGPPEIITEGIYDVLLFIGDKGIPFTILRHQNYEALKYYRANKGNEFQIKVERHGTRSGTDNH